ncbi:unnamed protein product [Candidula unifasciata]|uniref:non-specific serine/threonine protein kinase n=1 Tax=Candidula unifasciata TaxID=100452 RepID=A0A8S3Z338_9EUPU|nr:unnamed protein product [Candidula unifasciata]
MYQIHQKLGQGAFGIVYHLQISSGSEFALKVAEMGRLKKDITDSSTEARLMLKLSHAHLVQCCASFSHSGIMYLVMELCPCGTLKNFLSIRTRLVRETQILVWLGQIADALRYLHACRVIHRDLKTDNVFLNDKKNVKVGDLGIARELDYTAQKAGTFTGTFCYMSPEVLQSSAYSFETDIWGLGCCIHEVMTLRQTFAAQSMMDVMSNIMEARVPPMPDVYSQRLQGLVLQMLEKEPKNRPDGLEILLAVSKIQGFPFESGPFVPLENIKLNQKMLMKAVQTFELKSSRNQNIISHRDKSTFQHFEDVDEIKEDKSNSTNNTQLPLHIERTSRNHNPSSDSERKTTSKSRNMKQEGQNNICKTEKISESHKLPRDVQVQQYEVFDKLVSSSQLCSNKSVDGSSSLFSEYMDCLARDSQQWLRMKFGSLEKEKVLDDDCDSTVTLYTRAQVVRYNNTKNHSNR